MKNNLSKRIISLFLTLVMVLSINISAFAVDTVTITMSIETRAVNGQDILVTEQVSVAAGTNAESILLDLCKQKNINVNNTGGWIQSIGNVHNDSKLYHAWSGWIYKVNNEMAQVGAKDFIPKNGDVIRWQFSVNGDMQGSDLEFADSYLNLKKLIAQIDGFDEKKYAEYSEAQMELLLNLYKEATEKVKTVDNYPSKEGKAAGIAGFVQAENLSGINGQNKVYSTLIKKLSYAINKKNYIPAESIKLNESKITLVKGEKYKLSASVLPENATDTEIIWDAINIKGETSSDVLVAQDGTITAKELTSFAAVRARHSEVFSPEICKVKVVDVPNSSDLTSLSLTGATIAPAFAADIMSYRAEVPETTESIEVHAAAPGSKITINGAKAGTTMVPLKLGENLITIRSKVLENPEKVYTIKVIRKDLTKHLLEIANNISSKFEYTADQWRILDTVYHLGRDKAKVNKSLYIKNANSIIKNPKTSLGSLATTALTLTALGEDVTKLNVDGETIDLVSKIANSTLYKNQAGELDIFGTCHALYALTPYTVASDSVWTQQKIVSALIGAALPDGSWGFDGKSGDIDMTAMMICALAPFKGDSGVKTALDSAVSYLSKQQQNNGGYTSFGLNNANSAEMVLIALSSMGIDAGQDGRFIKNGNNVIDAILSFKTEDNTGFGFTDIKYNTFATEQGLRAIAAYIKYLEAGKPKTGKSPYVFTGFTGSVLDGAESDANLTGLTLNSAQTTPTFDPAVTTYSATVSASSVTVIPTVQQSGATITVAGREPSQAVPLKVGQNNLAVVVKAKNNNSKTYQLIITRPGSGNGSEEKPVIRFSVKGLNSKDIIAENDVQYQSGDTPYSVLKRAADARGIKIITTGSGSSVYVSSIDGLAEFDYGSGSGWMYSVNGTFYQKSAASYQLKENDRLNWIYTKNLGGDVGGGYFSGAGKPKKEDESDPKNTLESQKIIKSLRLKKELTAWEIYGLARAGEKVEDTQYQALKKQVIEKNGQFRKVTDAAGISLAVNAMGKDARNVEGIDLISHMLNSDRMLSQGTNGPIFALVALDSKKYSNVSGAKWTREKLISYILEQQKPDGGIPLLKGEESNIDITAMALTALAEYRNREDVKVVVDRALQYLSKHQKLDGGYALFGQENSESISQVIIALTSLQIDIKKDPRFIKNNKNLLDALQEYQLADGTYSHNKKDKSDSMATEQALLALLSYQEPGALYKLGSVIFADEQEISTWAVDSVRLANEKKIMMGSGGSFHPKNELTRAELAQILCRALKLENKDTTERFADISQKDWYYSAIQTACANKIMLGADGTFRPNEKITREELAVVLYRALKLSEKNAEIEDIDDVSGWAKAAVKSVHANSIMQGARGKFDPLGCVTREMAATVCIRSLNVLN